MHGPAGQHFALYVLLGGTRLPGLIRNPIGLPLIRYPFPWSAIGRSQIPGGARLAGG